MIDLSGIARHLHLSLDQIRLAADLLEQGYAPTFISRYRADETGSLPKSVLWRLKLHIDHQQRLEAARQRVAKQLPKDVGLDPEASRCIEEARTVVAIESVLKSFRARRALEVSQERDGTAGKLLEKMLTYSGPVIEDIVGWASQEVQGDEEAGKQALSQVTRLLGALMQCDTALNARLRNAIQRKATISVENPPVVTAPTAPTGSISTTSQPIAAVETTAALGAVVDVHVPNLTPDETSESADKPLDPEDASQQSCMTDEQVDVAASDVGQGITEAIIAESHLTNDHNNAELGTDQDAEHHDDESADHEDSDAADAVDEPVGKSGNSKRNSAKLTPRQRRRRWLTTMLAPLRSIKKPLSKLTAYQHLMLGRGVRSQLIATPLEYDRSYLADIARDSFTDSKHPLANWFSEAATRTLEGGLLAKLEAEALAEMEEEASESLLEHATDELRQQLMRRPVRGHTIALVDTVGPKTVSLVVVDPQGGVLASEELPCSVQPELVNQNVVKLGELIHKHRVTLVALTNGPARRFMVSTLRELMVQSKDSGLRWTMADRSGAEAYAGGRIGLKELATYNRRERAAIWTARCLQNPLVELLKVDIGRLRLGSYQRELPQEPLKQLVQDTIVDCVCTRGIDTLHASENELQYVPGVGTEQAKQIVKLAAAGQLTNRSQLKELISPWPEMNQRQALGWLRVFASTNTLDATLIHPEDYRLAERLIENTELSAPEAAPPGWIKRVTAGAAVPIDATPAETAGDAVAMDSAESVVPQTDVVEGAVVADSISSPSTSEESAVENPSEAPKELAAEELGFKPAGNPAGVTAAGQVTPEYPEEITTTTVDAPVVDAEKLANQWQVGRAKLRTIAAALQDPFADPRLQEPPVPLRVDLPTLDTLEPDACVWAIVVGVADFGAFVELGPNCSGLIHISRLSTHFIEDPHQCVQVGDLLMTWVVNVDKKKNRVALTALSPAQRAEVQAAADQRKAQAEQERSNRYASRGGDRGPRRDGPQGHGGQSQGQGQGRGHGQAGGHRPSGQDNQNRRTDSGGQRSGQTGVGQRAGQQSGGASRSNRNDRSGGRDRGQSGRGGGRGRDGDSGGDRPAKSVVVKSKKPVAPISQAMKEGDEPLRSFSDLLQFYESKRTTPEVQEVADVSANASESTVSNANTSANQSQPVNETSSAHPDAGDTATAQPTADESNP